MYILCFPVWGFYGISVCANLCLCIFVLCFFFFWTFFLLSVCLFLSFLDTCLNSNDTERKGVELVCGDVGKIWQELGEGKLTSEYIV